MAVIDNDDAHVFKASNLSVFREAVQVMVAIASQGSSGSGEWDPLLEAEQEHYRILDMFGQKKGLFLATIGKDLVQFGCGERIPQHLQDFDTFLLFDVVLTEDPCDMEKQFRDHWVIEDHCTAFTTPNGRQHTVVRLSTSLTKSDVRNIIHTELEIATKEDQRFASAYDVALAREMTMQIQIQEHEITERLRLQLALEKLQLQRMVAAAAAEIPDHLQLETTQQALAQETPREENDYIRQWIAETGVQRTNDTEPIHIHYVNEKFTSWVKLAVNADYHKLSTRTFREKLQHHGFIMTTKNISPAHCFKPTCRSFVLGVANMRLGT